MAHMDEEERAFQRRYGPWQPWSTDELAHELAGFPAPWWLCGGHAIEKFTGVRRGHDDLDVGMFHRDLPKLHEHFGDRLHLWSVGSGAMRPLDNEWPELHAESAQVWVREHALAPWHADFLMTRADESEWVFKLEPSFRVPLDEATWVDDGLRILKPEIVIAHKAKLDRPKDDADFAVTWPLLDGAARHWLRDMVARLFPRHPWLNQMAAPAEPVRRDGGRIRLREACVDDAVHFDAWQQDRATMMGQFNDFGQPAGAPLVENLDRGQRMVSHDTGQLVVERISDKAVLGDVSWHLVGYGPNPESRAANIGISLIPSARGQGYGGEAQRLLAELLFELYDFNRVEASTDVENVAEQRALEKSGFIREGVLRQTQYRAGGFHDLVVYSLVRSELGG